MFPLEKLALELILMVIQEVTTIDKDVEKLATCRTPPAQTLSALIWASPISFRLYNASPSLVHDRLFSLAQWILPRDHAHMQAYNAAALRFQLAGWEGVEQGQLQRLLEPHIERSMRYNNLLDRDGDASYRSFIPYDEYLASLQSKFYLGEFLDLANRAQRFSSRLVAHLQHQRSFWTGCTVISTGSSRVTTREDMHEPLLRFQTYCDTFFRQDDVLADEAARYRRAYFTRFDEVSSTVFYGSYLGRASGRCNGHHELFYLVLHHVFDEHKNILRDVTHDLRAKALAHEKDAARQAQIMRLHNRTIVMEDGYCRYMLSFGLDLVDRLLRMSSDEKREYTLTEFSWFSMTQEPQACYLENTAVDGWAPTEANGTRWEDSKDHSRMAYTAWFWELARRAQVGTNSR